MDQDWDAVAEAMTSRMTELGMRQRDLAHQADVGLSTVQELANNWKPRRRNPKTLAAISLALGWSTGRLHAIATGSSDDIDDDGGIDVVAELRHRLAETERRLTALENRIGPTEPE